VELPGNVEESLDLPIRRLLGMAGLYGCCVLVRADLARDRDGAISVAKEIKTALLANGVNDENLVMRLVASPNATLPRADLYFGGDDNTWWPAGEDILDPESGR
jgi:hypothetical protein